MEIIEKEATPLQIVILIRRRGVVLEWQTFLNEFRGRSQVFRTKVASKQIVYVCYHFRPFLLMLDRRGRFFGDKSAVCFQNKS